MAPNMSPMIRAFFAAQPRATQTSCHDFILTHLATTLAPSIEETCAGPWAFQQPFCYIAVLYARYGSDSRRTLVYFYTYEIDLEPTDEAHRIHGKVVPRKTYRGMFEQLYVYTCVMKGVAFEDMLVPLTFGSGDVVARTVSDLADIVSWGAIPDPSPAHLPSLLEDLERRLSHYAVEKPALHENLCGIIAQLRPRLPAAAPGLPLVLAHPVLAPHNFMIDPRSGRIRAVLAWEGARYRPVGTGLDLINVLFHGRPPAPAWAELEEGFYMRVVGNLEAQGFPGVTRVQLSNQMALGMLLYLAEGVPEGPGDGDGEGEGEGEGEDGEDLGVVGWGGGETARYYDWCRVVESVLGTFGE